jgi:hypothetical protein
MPVSYPHPQDRHRDRKKRGHHPYKDAKEAEAFGEARANESEEERLRWINTEFATGTGEQSGSGPGA